MSNQEKTKRVLQAIAECDRFIEKETPRNAALRPADIAAHLEFCKAHKAKLVAMIAAA